MFANSGPFPSQELSYEMMSPVRGRVGGHGVRQELTVVSPPSWTNAEVPTGLSNSLWNSYQCPSSDHIDSENKQLPVSPPTSDYKDMSSNYPNSSSNEDLAITGSQMECRGSRAPEKQRLTVHKQHTVTFHNARQLRSKACYQINSTRRDIDHTDSSDDEKPSELAGSVFPNQEDLAGHRPNGKVQPDPCSWSLEQVQSWLRHECRKHNIESSLQEKFHMNGKGLILMGLQGFELRIPHRGRLLHRDLQRLLRMQHHLEHEWRRPTQAIVTENN